MRTSLVSILGTLVLGATNLTVCVLPPMCPAQSQVLPQSTAIPVRFEHSVDTKKAKVGEAVTAKTIQVIALPGGRNIPKGALLVGHVVALEVFHFDETPYAHQKPSMLSIHFDKLQTGDAAIPVNLSVRAIASTIDSREAAYPHSTDDTDHRRNDDSDWRNNILSIGQDDPIGGRRRHRIQPEKWSLRRLIASGTCNGTDTEQSIAIFSPDACGAYGFGGDYLADSGRDGSGTFTLALRGHSLKLYAGSTALLEVNETK